MAEEQGEIEKVTSRIVSIRGTQVIIDRDIAELYGVETRVVNQAVRRNAEKFPQDYMFQLSKEEKAEVITNCDHLQKLRFSSALPYVFTEQGLYMLATILKSPVALDTTFAIINTFTKLRQLSRAMQRVNADIENGGAVPSEKEQGKFKQLMNEVFADPLPVKMQRMTFGVNLGFFKITVETTRGR